MSNDLRLHILKLQFIYRGIAKALDDVIATVGLTPETADFEIARHICRTTAEQLWALTEYDYNNDAEGASAYLEQLEKAAALITMPSKPYDLVAQLFSKAALPPEPPDQSPTDKPEAP